MSRQINFRKKVVPASLTIEAAIIVSMLLILFGAVMKSGIMLYTECRDTAAAICAEPELETVKTFYLWQNVGDGIQHGDGIY